MAGNALGELDDGRFRRERAPATIELAADGLRLSGFAIAKADEFDDQRVAGLLAAAYGGRNAAGILSLPQGRACEAARGPDGTCWDLSCARRSQAARRSL
jgi:hypothetical protein